MSVHLPLSHLFVGDDFAALFISAESILRDRLKHRFNNLLLSKRDLYCFPNIFLFWPDPFEAFNIQVSVHYLQKQNHLEFNLKNFYYPWPDYSGFRVKRTNKKVACETARREGDNQCLD